MIKKYLLILLLLIGRSTYSQKKINVYEVKSAYAKSILCSVDTVIFKSNTEIAVIFYKVDNPAGSAHMQGTDEISNKFLIAVSSIDDSPEQHLYSVGDFYNPKILKFEKLRDNNYRLLFEHGIFTNKKKTAINISLKRVGIVTVP